MNRRSQLRRPKEGGFALLLVFMFAAAVAFAIYQELPRAAFESARDKEQLLMDRGHQYERAIQVYYTENKRYPAELKDLEEGNQKRYLRRRYKDPMTGKDEWRIIHTNGSFLTDSLVQKPPTQNAGNGGPAGSAVGGGPLGSNTMNTTAATTPVTDPNAPPAPVNAAVQRRPSDRGFPHPGSSTPFNPVGGAAPFGQNGGPNPGSYDPNDPRTWGPISLVSSTPAAGQNGLQPSQQLGQQPGQQPGQQQLQQPVFNPNQPVNPNQSFSPNQPFNPGQPFNPNAGGQPFPGQQNIPGQNIPGQNNQQVIPGQAGLATFNPGIFNPLQNNPNPNGQNQNPNQNIAQPTNFGQTQTPVQGFNNAFGQPGTPDPNQGQQNPFNPNPQNQFNQNQPNQFNQNQFNPTPFGQNTGAGNQNGPFGNPGNQPSSVPLNNGQQPPAGGLNAAGGGNAALQSINDQLFRPNQGLAGPGQTTTTPGIAGVASKHEGPTIKSYHEKTRYQEWEFIFIPSNTNGIQNANTLNQNGLNPNGQQLNPLGSNPSGQNQNGQNQNGQNQNLFGGQQGQQGNSNPFSQPNPFTPQQNANPANSNR